MLGAVKWLFLSSLISLVALQSADERSFRQPEAEDRTILDWIGLGTGPDTDPYLAKTNAACLEGDLAECFKSRALASLDDFFNKPQYSLTEHVRILRMPQTQLRQLNHEPYEYSSVPRADEPEWDQLVKFGLRKIEKFLKSSAIEVQFDNEVTESGRYAPRFIDEIADEIDVIEDKKDSLFKRKQLKKLFIPMLIILKLFKLKLLLFLPLILGLASFKKLLGFLAIVIPGLIGFFKLCKPNLQSSNYYTGPHYSPAGVGYPGHFRGEAEYSNNAQYGAVHFGDDNNAQHLAYNGWSHYRNNGGDIKAEETTSKKSILPDS
ncbi:uncharacterized protein LOC123015666 [Tribolium madens]|uniref:uncharacterized protein LOC123015666 n=1 Tax=Tribolium madens TaxID=41895 RepID=UPI001CF7622F|nr:uncharacterized protein LOC123015666 [Tribolium madens]